MKIKMLAMAIAAGVLAVSISYAMDDNTNSSSLGATQLADNNGSNMSGSSTMSGTSSPMSGAANMSGTTSPSDEAGADTATGDDY